MSGISKKTTAVAALIAGSIALVGAGAGATFTDHVSANGSVEAGKINLQITVPAGEGTVSADGKSVTFKIGPTGSALDIVKHITVSNASSSTINANGVGFSLHKVAGEPGIASAALVSNMNVSVDGWGAADYDTQMGGQLVPGELQEIPVKISGDLPNEAQGGKATVTLTLDVAA